MALSPLESSHFLRKSLDFLDLSNTPSHHKDPDLPGGRFLVCLREEKRP